MRRQVAIVTLCGLLVVGGCVDAGIDIEGADGEATSTPTVDIGDAAANGTLSVHYLDVGQADATLLVSPAGETMLIDSGGWRVDGRTVIDYLESRGIDRIDHLVATHAHADHVGGHAAVIEHYETEKEGVGAVYDSGVAHTSKTYERYLDAVERHDVTLFEVAEGDRIPFAGVEATVLNPEEPGGEDLHENGVVVHAAFGETAFLFTGDAERGVENRLVDTYGDALDAEVYQAGHHGSNTSSGPPLLDAVAPRVAVVSSAYDSQYGHPHDEPLERFATWDVQTLWTAVHGTIVVTTDGEELTVRTQQNATTDPLAVQDADQSSAAPRDETETRFTVTVGGTDRLAPVGSSAMVAPGHP